MQTFILKEGVLNDDELYLADENKVFSGNYIAIITQYIFETHWTNKRIIKRFRKEEQLKKYIGTKYPEFDLDI
jgi:hypothetical protein